jgi:hypothetical protein
MGDCATMSLAAHRRVAPTWFEDRVLVAELQDATGEQACLERYMAAMPWRPPAEEVPTTCPVERPRTSWSWPGARHRR